MVRADLRALIAMAARSPLTSPREKSALSLLVPRRNLQGWAILLRAARSDALGVGKCEQHRAGGTDRGIRGGRGRAAHDVYRVVRHDGLWIARVQTGLRMTRNPSRGFGIGHICQPGV